MVKAILSLDEVPTPSHAADALAVAICHALAPPLLALRQVAPQDSGARLRNSAVHVITATGGGPSEGVAAVRSRGSRHVHPRFRRHDGDRRGRPDRCAGAVVVPFAFGLALLGGAVRVRRGLGRPLQPGRLAGDVPRPAADGHRSDRRTGSRRFAGAILASLVLLLATSKHEVASTATVPSSNGTAFVMEVAFTAIFVAVILSASKSKLYAGAR